MLHLMPLAHPIKPPLVIIRPGAYYRIQEMKNICDLNEVDEDVCSNHRLSCSCGLDYANLVFKNHVLHPMVISNLYCPKCSQNVDVDDERMLVDNDWILEFDLALARGFLQRANLSTIDLSPVFLFDHGYATWNGFTPNELDHRLAERQEIIALADQNMHQYLAEIKRWGCERAQKFREAGWRKALSC